MFTKRDYVRRAEGVCTSTLDAMRGLAPPRLTGSQAARDAALAIYLGHLMPLMRHQLRRIRALPTPAQTRKQTREQHAYLASLSHSIDEFSVLAAAARARSTGLVNGAEAALAADPTSHLAASYGLKVCSSSAPTYT